MDKIKAGILLSGFMKNKSTIQFVPHLPGKARKFR